MREWFDWSLCLQPVGYAVFVLLKDLEIQGGAGPRPHERRRRGISMDLRSPSLLNISSETKNLTS